MSVLSVVPPLLLASLRGAPALPSGGEAISEACADLTPRHPGSGPQEEGERHPFAFKAEQQDGGNKWKVWIRKQEWWGGGRENKGCHL